MSQELAHRLWGAIYAGHVDIERSHNGALILPMARFIHTFMYRNYHKYRFKKGVRTAAILEGVEIGAPLMGHYTGWVCGQWFVDLVKNFLVL